ncbi:MAG: PQQ-binding-like beta-propeller repeat protein [Prolixibacteraceae bacterium]
MRSILILAGIVLPIFLQAQISQWRGINRDGFFNEEGLLSQWPEEGPALVLTVENLGKGWSSPVVANNMIYITGMKDTSDVLSAIDQSGNLVWQTPYGSSWSKSFPDTRSTPTIENNKVFVTSGSGQVVCIDANTGAIVWEKNAFLDNGGEYGNWGIAENLLIVDDKIVFTCAGAQTTMIALDKNTGDDIWKSESVNDEQAYVSPILITYNGIHQIIGLGSKILFGVEPSTGKIVWSYDYCHVNNFKWDDDGVINCTSPVFYDGGLYVTSGYNHTSAKFQLKDDLSSVDFQWENETLDNHHGGVVLIDGYLYGSNWLNNSKGNWCSLNWETGEVKFEEEFDTKGSIISTPGQIYIYTEKKGMVALVKPNSDQFEIISSFQITEGEGAHWAHPFIQDGKLYIRHGNTLLVYNIKA